MSVYNYADTHPEEWQITGACEEDAADRERLQAEGKVKITHDNYLAMLDSVECDVIAVGDYFAKRGSLIITALQRGKHVLSDKPICTDLEEFAQIEQLAKEKNLKVGCQLTIRGSGNFRRMRELIREGIIGDLLSVSIGGQHTLNYGKRPAWYFEPGKHGGTINDIGVHGFDLIPWLTGHDFAEVIAARAWNAIVPQHPHFQTGGQYMLRLTNDAGVLADMSYFSPSQFKGRLPQYWRTTFFGTEGVIETSTRADITVSRNGQTEVEIFEALPPSDDLHVARSFAREVQGLKDDLLITMPEVMYAGRIALLVQAAADKNQHNVLLPPREQV